MQQAVQRRIPPCRMVRDTPSRKVVQSKTHNEAAETASQSQSPEGPEQAQSSPRVQPESHEPTERQPNFLFWTKLNWTREPEPCDQPEVGANAETFPTHLRPFSSPEEYKLVKHTYQQLQHSGYYWGPMTMEEAHEVLGHSPLGTFLIRDSGQPDVFFTLSYHSDNGPTSVRILLSNLLFSLNGSHRNFESLFALLTFYTGSSCKLTLPYRRQRPECLKQICRRAFVRTHGAEGINTLPGLSYQVKTYVHAYSHCI